MNDKVNNAHCTHQSFEIEIKNEENDIVHLIKGLNDFKSVNFHPNEWREERQRKMYVCAQKIVDDSGTALPYKQNEILFAGFWMKIHEHRKF